MLEINGYEIHIANDLDTRLKIYSMLFHEYFKKGYAKNNKSEYWFSKYNLQHNTITIYIKKKDIILNTVTIVCRGEYGLPCEEIFKEEVEMLINNGHTIVETISLSNFETKEKLAFEFLLIITLLVSYSYYNASFNVATINPRHLTYYSKYLNYNKLGETKNFQKVNNAPADFVYLKNSVFFEKIRCSKLFNNTFNNYELFEKFQNSLSKFIENNHAKLTESDVEKLLNIATEPAMSEFEYNKLQNEIIKGVEFPIVN
ncbi:MAG: hypothetical protein HOO91_04785 [Bacteroidales bacterium]|nr:hypothetical protein [Bacteroidales bacterium]